MLKETPYNNWSNIDEVHPDLVYQFRNSALSIRRTSRNFARIPPCKTDLGLLWLRQCDDDEMCPVICMNTSHHIAVASPNLFYMGSFCRKALIIAMCRRFFTGIATNVECFTPRFSGFHRSIKKKIFLTKSLAYRYIIWFGLVCLETALKS